MLAATVCVYFACSESGKDELAPSAPTTLVSDAPTGEITSRANCGGSLVCPCDCCCGLTLISPTNTDIDIKICGPAIGCFPNSTQCTYGGGCGLTGGQGMGGNTFLNTSGGNDTKIFCSGGVGDIFEIENLDTIAARFVIECGGSASNQFTLQPGEKTIIRKGTDCNIDPADPCIY